MEMTRPNLESHVVSKDVNTKKGGYEAKYMAWAKVAQIINVHANQWQFCLKFSDDGNPVWKAPDGTGYLQCYFQHDDGQTTSINVFSIMDYKNSPIKYEKISARDLTDSHRRALCQTAALSFSLGWELWADKEISDEKESGEKVELRPEPHLDQPKLKTKDDLIEHLMTLITQKMDDETAKAWVQNKAETYKIRGEGSKLKQMSDIHLHECIKELNNAQ